jgi:hypothetical protein
MLFIYLAIYLLAVLGFELRALYWQYWGLNWGSYVCQAGSLPLEALPFCCGYFVNRVLHLCQEQPGLRSSYLCFPCSWDDRHVSLCPAFIDWDGTRELFAQVGFKLCFSLSLPLE